MIHVRRAAITLSDEHNRLLRLAPVVFLWHAFVGIYFLSIVQQYLPNKLDAGLAYSGYAMASYGIAKFLLQTPAGWVSDRIGRRATMLFGGAISLPTLALMMVVPNEMAFLAFSFVLGIGAATMWPAFMAHVGETTPHNSRNRTMSFLNVAMMGGAGIGTFIGVIFADYMSYSAVFWLCIGFNALALYMVARNITDKPIVAARIQEHAQRTVKDPTAWTPSIGVLAVIVLFLTLGTSLHTPMIGAYAKDFLHVKMSHLAIFFPAPALIAAVIFWRYTRIADRFSRHVPLIGGLFVAALCLFGLTLTPNPMVVVSLVVLAGLACAISIPAWSAVALDATDAGGRGVWLGALATVQGVGVAGGQGLGGLIGGVWGPLAPFKIAALMLFVAVVLIFAHYRLQTRGRKIRFVLPAPQTPPTMVTAPIVIAND